ncbi:MAG: aldo/keto reductase [Bryobacteraceae bacterium]|nr:aldo/keto reductase [Bryobacteraceae bacterium]
MSNYTRRELAMAATFLPMAGQYRVWAHPVDSSKLVTRPFGRTGREVTTFGLAGGNKVMWDLPGDEGVEIVVKAIRNGITYLETANNYQLSQRNYHKAFRILKLIPGEQGYDHNLRGRLFLATKTGLRYSVIRDGSKPMGRSAGGGKTCVDDLMRALTQFFGDGKGFIPEGAYLDLMQIHFLSAENEVDAIYEGLENPSDKSLPRIGALAGLVDFRDGTNHTGANPGHKKYIRHIGITGHENAAAHMYAIRRDTKNVIETLLVAINPNDRHYFCHQTNSVPVAAAKGMGIIGMKIFADGALYGLEKKYASQPGQSVLSVGQKGKVSHQDFLRYTLSAEGVSTLITGIGLIDKSNDPGRDQLIANLEACQIRENLPPDQRRKIEERTAALHGTDNNFFQRPACGMLPPQKVAVSRAEAGTPVKVSWHTAFAAGERFVRYEVYRRDERIASILWKPQISEAPFTYEDAAAPAGHSGGVWYKVRAVDAAGAYVDSMSVKLLPS